MSKVWEVNFRKEQVMRVFVSTPDGWSHDKLMHEIGYEKVFKELQTVPLASWVEDDGPFVDWVELAEDEKQRPDYVFS